MIDPNHDGCNVKGKTSCDDEVISVAEEECPQGKYFSPVGVEPLAHGLVKHHMFRCGACQGAMAGL